MQLRHGMKPIRPAIVVALGLAITSVAHADLTAADVKQVMTAHAGEVRQCYVKHAQDQKGATGQVVLDVGVQPSGAVDKVDVDAPGVEGTAFPRCVRSKVMKWRFPENKGTVVTIPFRFYHASPDDPQS